jgi:hypothetical protein
MSAQRVIMSITVTLRFGQRAVRTPSGAEWRVGRRWISRRMPRWRRVRLGDATGEPAALNMPDFGSLDDIGTGLLIVGGGIILAVILIPLLLFGIELIIVGLLVAAGIVGRGLLGRPWVVQATPVGASAGALAWRVVGWRRSTRLIDEVAVSLASGLDPVPAEPCQLIDSTAPESDTKPREATR